MENTYNTKYIVNSFHSPLSIGVGRLGDQRFASARRRGWEMGGGRVGVGEGIR